MSQTPDTSLRSGLSSLLQIANVRPLPWVSSIVVVSIALALLEMLGIAAMLPLMQLFADGDEVTGVGAVLGDFFGLESKVEIVLVTAAIVVGVFIIRGVTSILFRWWLLTRTTRIGASAATTLLREYALAPYRSHRSRQLPEIYRNVKDITYRSCEVLLCVVTICADAIMLTAVAVVMVMVSPLAVALSIVLFGTLIIGTQRALRRRQQRIGEVLAEADLEAWQYLIPVLDGFREARTGARAGALVNGFGSARRRLADASRDLSIVTELPKYLLEIGLIVSVAVLSAVLFATVSPAEALAVLGVFAAAALRVLPTLNRMAAMFGAIRTGRVSLEILAGVHDELQKDGFHDERPRSGLPFTGDIELTNVSFSYPDTSELILDNVNLTIPQNSTIGFVGSSGAGKTTLLDLILGLLSPTSGEIRRGGRLIQDDLAAWYLTLGMVSQDVFLLNDTLRENIVFGADPDGVDEEWLQQVLRMSQLDTMVAALPAGIDTRVGERGTRLSGGQRQRVGIARALYRRPSVLVLDEATSALDSITEQEISATIEALKGEMTVIIVAHRLSTVRKVDKLCFLQQGRIVAEGSFDDVRAQNPEFARLAAAGGVL